MSELANPTVRPLTTKDGARRSPERNALWSKFPALQGLCREFGRFRADNRMRSVVNLRISHDFLRKFPAAGNREASGTNSDQFYGSRDLAAPGNLL